MSEPRRAESRNADRRAAALSLVVAVVGAVGVAAGFWWFGAHAATGSEFPLDDAWIHQVYARGLWTEGAPTYNAGVPEAGFSSALWILILAPVHIASSPGTVVAATKIIGLIFAALTAFLVGVLTTRITGQTRDGIVATALCIAIPELAFAAVSGMEVTLASATFVLALIGALDRRAHLTGFALAAAALSRPEAAVAGPLVLIWLATRLPRERRIRGVLVAALYPAIAGAAWVAYNLRVTGAPLPNTFYVKSGSPNLTDNLTFLIQDVVVGHGAARAAVFGGLFAIGFAASVRSSRSKLLVPLGACGAVIGAIVVSRPLLPGFAFFLTRYFAPFTVVAVVPVAIGMRWLVERASDPKLRAVLVVVGALTIVGVHVPSWMQARLEYGAHCRDIVTLHTQPAMLVAERSEEGSRVAVEGAGALRYFSGREIVDLVGLNDHVLAHEADPRLRTCMLVDANPNVFVVPTSWLGELSTAFEFAPVASFAQDDWSVSGGGERREVTVALARPVPGRAERCAEIRAANRATNTPPEAP